MEPSRTAQAPPRSSRPPLPWYRRVAYATVAVLFFFVALELLLRIVGFSFRPNEIVVFNDGKRLAPIVEVVQPGMWQALPSTEAFNRDGFVGPEIPRTRQPGVLRIATVGDSCTQWGEPPYPAMLQVLLQEKLDRPVEVLNAGVIRYSTEQGLRRLEKDVLPYRPDIVTIYFGWNDHWTSEQRTDAALLADAVPHTVRWLRRLQFLRTVQAIGFGADLLYATLRNQAELRREYVLRVPPERYLENLRAMIQLVRAQGGEPILITAPTGATGNVVHWEGTLQGFSQLGFESHTALHDHYVSLTRQAAADEGVTLLDMRAALEGEVGLYRDDQIHLTQMGHRRLAEELAKVIAEMQGERSMPKATLEP